jgi:hypothetical protein
MDINERELLFNQKYLHQKNTVDYLHGVNTVLMYTYYLCIFVIVYYLFTKYELNKYVKFGISILLVLYPFSAYYIEQNIHNNSGFIWSAFSFLTYSFYTLMQSWVIKLLNLPYYYLYILVAIYFLFTKDGFNVYNQVGFFLLLILYPFIAEYIQNTIISPPTDE